MSNRYSTRSKTRASKAGDSIKELPKLQQTTKTKQKQLNKKESIKKVPDLGLVEEKEEVTNKTPLLDNPDRERSEMEEKIDRLLDSMAQLNSNVNKIEEKFNILQEKFNDLEGKIGELDKKWDAKLVTTQVRIDIVEKKITANSLTASHACEDVNLLRIENSKLIKQIDKNEDKIRQLEGMVDDMQGRLRRSTLVIKGVSEGAEGLSDNWSDVENLVMSILVKHLDLDENKIWIERAHRNPTHMTVREGAKPYCRPIYVGFLSWKTASLVLARAKKLKENPFIFKQEAVQIFIEPLYSPKVAKQRKDMLRVRYKLKQKHPSWNMFLRFPAKLVRRARDGNVKIISQDVINSVDEDTEEDDEL